MAAATGAAGEPPGPVQLNLPFAEPLVPDGRRRVPAGRPGGRPWTAVPPGRPAAAAAAAGPGGADAGRRPGTARRPVPDVPAPGGGRADGRGAGRGAVRTGPVAARGVPALRPAQVVVAGRPTLHRAGAAAAGRPGRRGVRAGRPGRPSLAGRRRHRARGRRRCRRCAPTPGWLRRWRGGRRGRRPRRWTGRSTSRPRRPGCGWPGRWWPPCPTARSWCSARPTRCATCRWPRRRGRGWGAGQPRGRRHRRHGVHRGRRRAGPPRARATRCSAT